MKTKFYPFKNSFNSFAPARNVSLNFTPPYFVTAMFQKPICGITVFSSFFKRLLPAFFVLLFTNSLYADYTINAGVSVDPNRTPALLNATGTISIYGTMAINSEVKFTSATPLDILIYGASGQIYWYANKSLIFPAGSSIRFVKIPTVPPGLQPTSGSASQILQIGTVKYAAANDNSNNVIFSFVEMNDIGGTAKVNPSASTPETCIGSTVNLSANPIIPTSANARFSWAVSPVSGSFSANNSNTSGSTTLANLAAGDYTITCNLMIDAGNGAYFAAASNTVPVKVKPLPAAIISGDTAVCQNASSPAIRFLGINGTAPYTFTYTTNSGINQSVTTMSGNSVTVPVPTNTAGSVAFQLISVQYAGAVACLQTQTGTASVTVKEETRIIQQPSTTSFCLGTDASLIAQAAGSAIAYQWQRSTTGIDGAYDNVSNSTVYNGANAAVLQIVAPAIAMSTDFFRLQVAGTCGVVISNPMALKFGNLWMGTVNRDWSNTGNWSDGTIPTYFCPDVHIPKRTNQPLLNTMPGAEVNNLAIDSGAVLTVANTTVKINGKVGNQGRLNIISGNIEFNGSAIQTVSGKMFADQTIDNLTISNKLGLRVDSMPGNLLNITGSISFGDVNNSVLFTGNNLVLVSKASSTARVADITNNNQNFGNRFEGEVKVERYFPSRRSWRLMTSPVSGGGSVFENWQNKGVYEVGIGTYVTGPGATSPTGANGLDWSSNNNTSLRTGVPSVNVLNTHNAKISRGLADTSDNLPYFIFVRGDRLPANTNFNFSSQTTLSGKGRLQTGRQTFTVSPVFNGFTMVGNPYASPVDMNKIVRNNVQPRFVVWDPYINSGTGAHVYFEDFDGDGLYTPTPSGTFLSNSIQSGQAFYVQTTSNGPAAVQFHETSKSSLTNLVTFRSVTKEVSLRANLYHLDADDSTVLLDGILAQFDDKFNTSVDGADALKESNIKENLGLLRAEKYLSVERRPMPLAGDTLFLQLSGTSQRKYRLEFNPADLGAVSAAFLLDAFTRKTIPISTTANTNYDFAVTEDAASASIDRFMVVFRTVTFKTIKAVRQERDIAIEWTVANDKNARLYELERSADGVNFVKVYTVLAGRSNEADCTYDWLDKNTFAGKNYYRIRRIANDAKFEYSNTVLVKSDNPTATMRVFPNPVIDNNIAIEFNNMPAGVYLIKLLNDQGQTMLHRTITHDQGRSVEYIQPQYKLNTGLYRLKIITPQKEIKMVKLIVR